MASSSFKNERALWFYLIEPLEENEIPIRGDFLFILRKSIEDKIFSSNIGDVCIKRTDCLEDLNFQQFKWDLVRQIENKFGNQPMSKVSISEALKIAIKAIDSQNKLDTYTHRRIIFFTEFHDSIDEKDIRDMAENLKSRNIFLSLVTTDSKEMDATQHANYDNFKKHLFINKCGRINTEYDTRKQILNTITKKAVKLISWNCLFDIEADFSIQLRGFSSIRENKATELKSSLLKENKDELPQPELGNGGSSQQYGSSNGTQSASTSAVKLEAEEMKKLVDKERIIKDKEGKVIDSEETTKGYVYGDQIVPLPDTNEAYKSGEKCLKLLLICPKVNIKPFYLFGDGVTRFFPTMNTVSELYFDALLTVLDKLQRVVIVRKVYRANVAPKIGVLSPDTEMKCLIYTDLCFSDDISIHSFAKLTSSNSNSDFGLSIKEEAMDELINAMSMEDFNPTQGPSDPNSLNLRDQIAKKIVPTNIKHTHLMKDGLELFFEKFFISEKLAEKLKAHFHLEVKKEEKNTSRPAGSKIFRKRDKEANYEDFIENNKVKIEIDQFIPEPMDQDDGLNTDDLLGEL